MIEDNGASADADRATRASTEPASRLGHSAGIPSAEIWAIASRLRLPWLHWDDFDRMLRHGADVQAAMMMLPEGWQYEISNNAIDRGIDRCLPPSDTIEELGPWCSLQKPTETDCFGEPDWFGMCHCGGSGGPNVAVAIARAVENIHGKGHLAQAIEAGTAKTAGLGPQDESAVPKGNAPTP